VLCSGALAPAARGLRADIADVDHALHSLGKLYERSKLGQAGDGSLHHRAHRKLLRRVGPWVAQRLFQTE